MPNITTSVLTSNYNYICQWVKLIETFNENPFRIHVLLFLVLKVMKSNTEGSNDIMENCNGVIGC